MKSGAAASSPQADSGAGDAFCLPLDTSPMEARLAERIPERDGPWQYEPKWDGFRCLAFKRRGAVELRAKSGKPLGRYFPEMLSLLRDSDADDFVADGELVVPLTAPSSEGPVSAGEPLSSGEWLSFDALQARLHPAESRIRKLARDTPARLILFDMLAAPGGVTLLAAPLVQRRRALEDFVALTGIAGRVVLSPSSDDPRVAAGWLDGAGHGATDGIVAKRLHGPYEPGERAMVKVKRLRTADCVIGGFRYESCEPDANGGRRVGSLLLGLYDRDGKLSHVGFTSAIADGERQALTARLEALRAPSSFTGRVPGGPSRWSTARSEEWEPIRPELVVEVRYDHVTGDRFRHGTKLVRWRPDKAPAQCTFDQIAPPFSAEIDGSA